MIYELCLNVMVDVVVLCFKVGNVVILCGGKEVLYFNLVLVVCLYYVLCKYDIDVVVVMVVFDLDCVIMNIFMILKDDVDLIILCGGEGLIQYVSECS